MLFLKEKERRKDQGSKWVDPFLCGQPTSGIELESSLPATYGFDLTSI